MKYANAERFLKSYNKIESQLKILYGGPPTQAFTDLVKRCSDRNITVRRYENELIDYGKLRNAIVHRVGGEELFIANPSDDVVDTLEYIACQLCRPPAVVDAFKGRKIASVFADKPLLDAVRTFAASEKKTLIVYDHGVMAGVLNAYYLYRLLAARAEAGENLTESLQNTPGGALLDALGKRGHADPHLFPRPYTHNDNLDFSFSGLKTAGALWLSQHADAHFPPGDTPARERLDSASQTLCDAAASYLLAVAETLTIKAERAMALFHPESIVVAGGVAANSVVRQKFANLAERHGIPLIIPRLSLCGDNAVMIAKAGWHMAMAGRVHDLSLSAIPRGQTIPQDWKTL